MSLQQDERAQDVKDDLQVAPNFPPLKLKPRLPTRTPDRVERGLVTYLRDADHGGAMVALRVPLFAARQVAVPGGEAPEDLHCTLAYLGDAADLTAEQLGRLRDALGRVCATQAPLEGVIQGYGRFRLAGDDQGDDGLSQDVLWAGLDSPDLPDLRHRVVQACRDAGVEPAGDHGFTPHVTLAYAEPGEGEDGMPPSVEVRFKYLSLVVGGREEAIELERGEPESGATPAAPPQTFSVVQQPAGEDLRSVVELERWAQDKGALVVRADVDARPCVVVKKGDRVSVAVDGVPAGEELRLDDMVNAMRRIAHDCVLYGWLAAKDLSGRWLPDEDLDDVLSGDLVAGPVFLGCDVLALDGDLTSRTALERMELMRAALAAVGGHAMVPRQVVCAADQDVEECVDEAMSWRPSEGLDLVPVGVTVVVADSTYTHGPTGDEVRLSLGVEKAWSDEARAAALEARRRGQSVHTSPVTFNSGAKGWGVVSGDTRAFARLQEAEVSDPGAGPRTVLWVSDVESDSPSHDTVRVLRQLQQIARENGAEAIQAHVVNDKLGHMLQRLPGTTWTRGNTATDLQPNRGLYTVPVGKEAWTEKAFGFGAGPGPGEPPDWRTKLPKENMKDPNFLTPERKSVVKAWSDAAREAAAEARRRNKKPEELKPEQPDPHDEWDARNFKQESLRDAVGQGWVTEDGQAYFGHPGGHIGMAAALGFVPVPPEGEEDSSRYDSWDAYKAGFEKGAVRVNYEPGSLTTVELSTESGDNSYANAERALLAQAKQGMEYEVDVMGPDGRPVYGKDGKVLSRTFSKAHEAKAFLAAARGMVKKDAAAGVFGTPGTSGIVAPQQGMFRRPQRKVGWTDEAREAAAESRRTSVRDNDGGFVVESGDTALHAQVVDPWNIHVETIGLSEAAQGRTGHAFQAGERRADPKPAETLRVLRGFARHVRDNYPEARTVTTTAFHQGVASLMERLGAEMTGEDVGGRPEYRLDVEDLLRVAKDENTTAGVAIIPISTQRKKPNASGVDDDAPTWPAFPPPVLKYVTHDGSTWRVHAESGRVLGTHGSKAEALAQLRAVEWHKAHPTAKAWSDEAREAALAARRRRSIPKADPTEGHVISRVDPATGDKFYLHSSGGGDFKPGAVVQPSSAWVRDRDQARGFRSEVDAREFLDRLRANRQDYASGIEKSVGSGDVSGGGNGDGDSFSVGPGAVGAHRFVVGRIVDGIVVSDPDCPRVNPYEAIFLRRGVVLAKAWSDEARAAALEARRRNAKVPGVTVFHGTTEKVVDSVIRRGLLTEKSGQNWSVASAEHVYVTTDRREAEAWASKTVQGTKQAAAVVEVRVPSKYKGYISDDENYTDSVDKQFEGDVPAEWVVGLSVLRKGKWHVVKGAVDSTHFVVVTWGDDEEVAKGDPSPSDVPADPRPRKWPDLGAEMGSNDTFDSKSAEDREQRERDRMSMVGAPISKVGWTDEAREAALEARRRRALTEFPDAASVAPATPEQTSEALTMNPDDPANKKALAKARIALHKRYDSGEPGFRATADVVAFYTQGEFEDVRERAELMAGDPAKLDAEVAKQREHGKVSRAEHEARVAKWREEGSKPERYADGRVFATPHWVEWGDRFHSTDFGLGSIGDIRAFNGEGLDAMSQRDFTEGVKGLQSAIANAAPSTYPVYRGLKFENTYREPPPGAEGNAFRDLVSGPSRIPEYKVGEEVSFVGPSSFTRDRQVAEDFADGVGGTKGRKDRDRTPPGRLIVQVEPGARGVNVDVFSTWKQKEFLTQGRFQVVSVHDEDRLVDWGDRKGQVDRRTRTVVLRQLEAYGPAPYAHKPPQEADRLSEETMRKPKEPKS